MKLNFWKWITSKKEDMPKVNRGIDHAHEEFIDSEQYVDMVNEDQSAFNKPADIEACQDLVMPVRENVTEPVATTAEEPVIKIIDYIMPSLDLFNKAGSESGKAKGRFDKEEIARILLDYGVAIQNISVTTGPTLTVFEVVPASGVKVSRIKALKSDLALRLAVNDLYINTDFLNRGTVGIEIPNEMFQNVPIRDILSDEQCTNGTLTLPIALGKGLHNESYILDLAILPHLLITGAACQGKTTMLHAIIMSLLCKMSPHEIKFIIADPKKLDLTAYRQIEHFFIATQPGKDAMIQDMEDFEETLEGLAIEMDNRFELLKASGARNIKSYNEHIRAGSSNATSEQKFLPYLILIVDNYEDLADSAGKTEPIISRLAMNGQHVGIHLVISYQESKLRRIVSGELKSYFPVKIALRLYTKSESTSFLEHDDAERLLRPGDMILSDKGSKIRLQGTYVDHQEIDRCIDFISAQTGHEYSYEIPLPEDDLNDRFVDLSQRDKLFDTCARIVVQTQNGSRSNLQRRLNLGYNRAERIMDQLEAAGIVGPAHGSKPREVLFHTESELEQFLELL